MSVVCRPLCVINNCFKDLFLKFWLDFEGSWQNWSLYGPLLIWLQSRCISRSKGLKIEPWYLVSSSRPLPSSLCPLWQNGPQWSHVYIGLYREKHEKILSKTTRPRAMIFGMMDHLVNLYQVCWNYKPGVMNGPPRGSHVLDRLI